jgi:hypothetical protein
MFGSVSFPVDTWKAFCRVTSEVPEPRKIPQTRALPLEMLGPQAMVVPSIPTNSRQFSILVHAEGTGARIEKFYLDGPE